MMGLEESFGRETFFSAAGGARLPPAGPRAISDSKISAGLSCRAYMPYSSSADSKVSSI